MCILSCQTRSIDFHVAPRAAIAHRLIPKARPLPPCDLCLARLFKLYLGYTASQLDTPTPRVQAGSGDDTESSPDTVTSRSVARSGQ